MGGRPGIGAGIPAEDATAYEGPGTPTGASFLAAPEGAGYRCFSGRASTLGAITSRLRSSSPTVADIGAPIPTNLCFRCVIHRQRNELHAESVLKHGSGH
eukprot:10828507-Lingulodinium_polyedra.AAC.1